MTDPATQSPTVLRVERTFNAPAQAVFDAWTSPEVMRRWWHAGADWETPLAEVDLRVGGSLRVTMRTPDGQEYSGGGEYTEVQPPERLAFTWTWAEESSPRTLVEVEFNEEDGATTVVLTHSGLSGEESKQGHAEGWRECLDNLGRALAA
jgi:uncharacterized protein YndB with AHSA1/START domain